MDPEEFLSGVPDYYVDSVNFATNLYGFMLEFGVMQSQDEPPRAVARVRMSPQHAKIMSLLMRKNVQEYERRVGTIILPEGLYHELGITDE